MASLAPEQAKLIEHARFLQAYLECSNAMQEGARAMLGILFDAESSENEKDMALHTLADILYPNFRNGKLGMDWEESESEAAFENPEFAATVAEMNQEEEQFSRQLRVIMESRGLTQAEVAARAGVSQPAIANMLGRQCRPQRRTVLKLAAALDVSPRELWPSFES